ncbi:MAG: hypothetical protein ACLQED_05585 [Desulfobaccales bacterium]
MLFGNWVPVSGEKLDKDDIKEKLERAVKNLFAKQPDIYGFTSQTSQTEWNLAHHLANEIHDEFNEYNCDLDISKPNYDNRRPDIIIHKRGSHTSNLLVIEVKRDGQPYGTEGDINKIKEVWFNIDLNYRFGATINLKRDMTYEINVIKNNRIP